jgi:hypothetical protein
LRRCCSWDRIVAAGQSERPSNEFIAFRFDGSHAIAGVKVLDDAEVRGKESAPSEIDRVQLVVVLNVLDRDGDGWGEIIAAGGGYEWLWIDMREYSASGVGPAAPSFAFGC